MLVLVSEQTPICLKHHCKSIQKPKKKKEKKRRHSPYFSTTTNPATIPPSKSLHHIPMGICQYPQGHTFQATKRLPINPSPLTQQPTNPIARPGQVLSKGFFTRHHPLESQRCHANKRLKRQPIPRPLWVPPLSQCNTAPPCRLRVPRHQPTPPEHTARIR